MAPRPVATVAILPFPKCIHVLWAGFPWDTKASLSLGQTTGVRGMGGLAMGETESCQEPASPPSWGGYWRILSTWPLGEKLREAGRSGRGTPGPIIPASCSATGSGEIRVRFSKLSHLPRIPLPPGRASSALQPSPAGSGTHSQGSTDRLLEGTRMRPLRLRLPTPPPQNFEVPRGPHMERV